MPEIPPGGKGEGGGKGQRRRRRARRTPAPPPPPGPRQWGAAAGGDVTPARRGGGGGWSGGGGRGRRAGEKNGREGMQRRGKKTTGEGKENRGEWGRAGARCAPPPEPGRGGPVTSHPRARGRAPGRGGRSARPARRATTRIPPPFIPPYARPGRPRNHPAPHVGGRAPPPGEAVVVAAAAAARPLSRLPALPRPAGTQTPHPLPRASARGDATPAPRDGGGVEGTHGSGRYLVYFTLLYFYFVLDFFSIVVAPFFPPPLLPPDLGPSACSAGAARNAPRRKHALCPHAHMHTAPSPLLLPLLPLPPPSLLN